MSMLDMIYDAGQDNSVSLNFGTHTTFKSGKLISNEVLDSKIDAYCYNYSSMQVDEKNDITKVTVEEVEKSVNNTKKDSSNDSLLSVYAIRKQLSSLAPYLALLLSLILLTGCVPNQLKINDIVPVYKKKGSRASAKNYRLINLLNAYCRIFESVFFYRLQVRIDSKLCNEQHGFRKNRSCKTALSVFTEYISKALDDKNGLCVAVYFDARKAFNSVDRNILINKMMDKYELEPNYLQVFKNYFTNCFIRIKGKKSCIQTQTELLRVRSLGQFCILCLLILLVRS